MTDRTKTIILIVVAVLLAPVPVLFLLAVSFAAGMWASARIYGGNHEGISDLLSFGLSVVIFCLLWAGTFKAVVEPLYRLLRFKYWPRVRKSHSSR
jgi:hypothetical protein